MRFVVTKRGLEPFDQAAHDFLKRQTTAEPIEIEAPHPRDMIFHRHVFGVIEQLAEALDATPELVRAELLYATGNFQMLGALMNRSPVIAVNSMSRNAMTDHELHEFWHDAKEVIEFNLFARLTAVEKDRLAELMSLEPA
jgi:hypothetical protein